MHIYFHKKVDINKSDKQSILNTIESNPFIGKLKAPENTYHTHLGYRRVAVWRRREDGMEVVYVGGRENAPMLGRRKEGRMR